MSEVPGEAFTGAQNEQVRTTIALFYCIECEDWKTNNKLATNYKVGRFVYLFYLLS